METQQETTAPRISVGFDESPSSRAAVWWAADQAVARGGSLRIVSAYHLPLVGDSTYAWTPTEAYRGLLEATEAGMHDIAQATRVEHPGLEVVTEPSAGPVGSLLIEGAQPGDLVVVGASAHKGVTGVLYGNTSHYLIRESPCAVAVVPATAHRGAPDRVVVGVDGSDDSQEALLWAGEEADRHGVGLVVVHAWNYPYRPIDPPSVQARDVMRIDAACVVEAAAATARDRFAAKVDTELVETGAAAALIESVRDGDLLVLGSRGRGALKSTIFGSTVNAVTEISAVPVVVVRPGRSALVDARG